MNAVPTRLAVDLGTTWTAAAVTDEQGTRSLHLGDKGAAIPSVVAVDMSGTLVVGAAAERVMAVNPDRGAREVKRRFGDTTPMVLAGSPYSPDTLTVALLTGVATIANIQPATTEVVLTHPANWGEYKLDLLRNVGAQAGFAATSMLSEPAAAARHYADTGRLAVGDAVVVYDFGGGTFDAAVIRLDPTGPTLLGQPQGIERLGGIDIDQVVFSHVTAALSGGLETLDRKDPDVRRAILQLRADCTTAKELLSADSETTIAVMAPGLHTQVRMTREELEGALRPRIAETVRSMERAVTSAGLQMGDLAGVVLVGGSSRLPIVAEVVAAESGRPVLFDADAKLVVATGAALPLAPASAAAAAAPTPEPAAAPAQALMPEPAGSAAAPVAAAAVAATTAAAAAPSVTANAPSAPNASQETTMSEPTNPESAARPERGGSIPPPPAKKKDEGKINPAVVGGVAAAAAAATAAAVVWGDDVVDAVMGNDDDGGDAADAALGGVSLADGAEHLDETRTADRIAREADGSDIPQESMDAFDAAVAAAQAGAAAGTMPPPAPAAPPASGPAPAGHSGGSSGSSGGGASHSAPRQDTPPPPPNEAPPAPPVATEPPAPTEPPVATEPPADTAEPPVDDAGTMPPPADPGTVPGPVVDQDFEAARESLLSAIDRLDLGEGVDDADEAELREELRGLVERAQVYPGQSTEDALATLRDQYDQHVTNFVQDQKIEALIQEQLRDNAAEDADDAEAQTPVDDVMPVDPDIVGDLDTTTPDDADATAPADTDAATPADAGAATDPADVADPAVGMPGDDGMGGDAADTPVPRDDMPGFEPRELPDFKAAVLDDQLADKVVLADDDGGDDGGRLGFPGRDIPGIKMDVPDYKVDLPDIKVSLPGDDDLDLPDLKLDLPHMKLDVLDDDGPGIKMDLPRPGDDDDDFKLPDVDLQLPDDLDLPVMKVDLPGTVQTADIHFDGAEDLLDNAQPVAHPGMLDDALGMDLDLHATTGLLDGEEDEMGLGVTLDQVGTMSHVGAIDGIGMTAADDLPDMIADPVHDFGDAPFQGIVAGDHFEVPVEIPVDADPDDGGEFTPMHHFDGVGDDVGDALDLDPNDLGDSIAGLADDAGV